MLSVDEDGSGLHGVLRVHGESKARLQIKCKRAYISDCAKKFRPTFFIKSISLASLLRGAGGRVVGYRPIQRMESRQMKIVGGSFGVGGSAFISRDGMLVVEGIKKAAYARRDVRSAVSRIEKEKKIGYGRTYIHL